MSRITKKSPVSANMFRHFAVITIVITACLALFVDGEAKDSVAEQVAAKAKQNREDDGRPNAAKGTRNALRMGQSGSRVSWGPDPGPQDFAGDGSDNSWTAPSRPRAPGLVQRSAPPLPSEVQAAANGSRLPGIGAPGLDTLEDADPAKRRTGWSAPGFKKPSQEEMEDILRASSERSGGSGANLDI